MPTELTTDTGQLMAISLLVFLIAGFIKGVVGLGLPTVSMALLVLIMSSSEAAALLVLPSLVTNAWQLGAPTSLVPLVRRLGPMQLGIFGGTLGGALLMGAPAGSWAGATLGLVLIAYAAWSLLGTSMLVPRRYEIWMAPLTGIVTGFVTAATGVFVVPAVPYLQSLGLARDHLIQAMAISFTVSTVSLAVGLGINGQYSSLSVGLSLVMLLPALLGMVLGQRFRHSLSPSIFRRFFLCSLLILGTYMIVKSTLF